MNFSQQNNEVHVIFFLKPNKYLLATLLIFISSCGAKTETKRDRQSRLNSDVKKAAGISEDAVIKKIKTIKKEIKTVVASPVGKELIEDKSCSGALTTSLGLTSYSKTTINGKSILFSDDRSLCDVLISAKTPVALFQFINSECPACLIQAENVAIAHQASEYRDGVKLVFVLTNFDTPVKIKSFEKMIAQIVPDASIVMDKNNQGWEEFASDPKKKDNPTLVAMAMSANGVIFNDVPDQYIDAIVAAEELVQAEVETFEKRTITQETFSALKWDGTSNQGTAVLDIILAQ